MYRMAHRNVSAIARRLVHPVVVAPLLAALAIPLLTSALHAQRPRPAPAPPRPAPQAAAQPPAEAQAPSLTFRVEVNYVEVDAIVVDRSGRFVPDLTMDDFRVLEDGRTQKIANFGLVDLPVERSEKPLFARRPIEPDVRSNTRTMDGRIYLIVLDQLHIAPTHTAWVRGAARKFIENLGTNDLAAVVSTRGQASQDFTNNKEMLLAAVDRFVGDALRSATLNRIDDYRSQQAMGGSQSSGNGLNSDGTSQNGSTGGRPLATSETAYKDADDLERELHASTTLGAIASLSDYLAGIHGRRKALVLFSEGIDYDIEDPFNNHGAPDVLRGTQDAIAAATRANVSVYAVDPRGLVGLAGYGAELGAPPIDADPILRLGPTGMQDETRMQIDSLRVLSEETGGFAAVNTNDYAGALDRIGQENSRYYVLGYYPVNDRRDGKFRSLEVKVNRPGLTVRSRKGYVAPRGKASATTLETKEGTPETLRELVESPLPIKGLRLTMTAAPFRGANGKASVDVVLHADGRDLTFTQKAGRYEDALDVAIVAVDQQEGKSKGGLHHLVQMPLQQATYQQVTAGGLRITSKLDAPPGRYQLRVAVAERNGRRTGSVHYDLEVPDFEAKAHLTMSGVVLTSTLAGRVRTVVAGADEFGKALPGPPTVVRDFLSSEEIALLAEVYDNETRSPHHVDIMTTLTTDDGRVVYKHADVRTNKELDGEKGGYGYTDRVPLKGLAPGIYVLKVEARSRLRRLGSVSKEIQIRVVQ